MKVYLVNLLSSGFTYQTSVFATNDKAQEYLANLKMRQVFGIPSNRSQGWRGIIDENKTAIVRQYEVIT